MDKENKPPKITVKKATSSKLTTARDNESKCKSNSSTRR